MAKCNGWPIEEIVEAAREIKRTKFCSPSDWHVTELMRKKGYLAFND